ncbi:MAG: transcriptional regulator [Candidatus Kerfeldbacteria bacterium RIFCSPHIGHO2_12_FULL_48_17]|uniref:Transcriptional regulator n=1 Tax=Candidatus Kerfeldbacteria bacterium RIFCSPHIGHO2_12_FULL_48_17 TaxID=1798542 RepID=A0A1G2B7M9_9BACT|nr:MAG: transcriptional regulator [Candidatus Kerfeldbacteria bacterium RIFCSPHIGHO2_12_FULL_48_17]
MKSYKTLKNQLLTDKQIRKAYDDLGPEFELIHMLIETRIRKGLTQKALAQKIGTKQSAISRLERGTYNPTVAFLRKLAKALGTDLHISFS